MSLLSIVVTCTDKKSLAPAPGLRARDLVQDTVAERAAVWWERLDGTAEAVPLSRLYHGDQWRQAQKLVPAAADAGFKAELWVASAGLGLRRVDSSAPAYAATLSLRHADSVGTSVEECAEWWRHLQEHSQASRLAELAATSQLLVVLSEGYARAMRDELAELGEADHEALLLGGAEAIPGLPRIPADASLRHHLGGTLTSLNTRTAAAWLGQCSGGRLVSPESLERWGQWVSQVARTERYDRAPMKDAEVVTFIERTAALHPDWSRTRMLRELRGSGHACEQRRFADLHARTMENR